jgi:phosphoribosylformimino-5-aminoimidazole carboxamide ribotide isomerase
LRQGDPAQATVYADDPVATARQWVERGATRLHVVDLGGAMGRTPLPLSLLAELATVGVPVQVGGGIRDPERARALLECGAAAVVVSSVVTDEQRLQALIAAAGTDRLLVSLDFRDGRLAVEGWTTTTPWTVADALDRVRAAGLSQVIVTAVTRDGTGTGPDVALAARCVAAGLTVVAAGGIASIADLKALRDVGAAGAIVGRALYDGRFSLAEAMEALSC